jgi:hypothetical protein
VKKKTRFLLTVAVVAAFAGTLITGFAGVRPVLGMTYSGYGFPAAWRVSFSNDVAPMLTIADLLFWGLPATIIDLVFWGVVGFLIIYALMAMGFLKSKFRKS